MRILLRDLTPGQDYAMQFRSNNGKEFSEWSKVYTFRTVGDGTPPADVTALDWKPTGESFIGTWTAPTLDSNGKPLKDFHHYEVTVEANGKSKVYVVSDTTWEFTLIMNAEAFGGIELTVKITVKAVDNTGNKSPGVNKTATEDTPPTPSTPIVTNTMGQLTVEWDGSTSFGVINPFNLQYVEIHASTTNNFTPSDSTIVGRFEGWIAGKQKTIVPGLSYGTVNYIKLVSVNKKGKKSTPSPQASGTPTRITGLDIQNGAITTDQINFAGQLGGGKAWYQTTAPTSGDGAKNGDTWFDTDDGYHPRVMFGGVWQEARDATIAAAAGVASAAQGTANGKNQVTYAAAAPVLPGNAGTRAGDIWFVRNGTTGVITAQYEWDGAAWLTRTLDNAVIANLDAGKITAGTLDANRISAGTITADKLTVAARADDLIVNGRFTDLNSSSMPVEWTYDTGATFVGATYATSTTAADIGSGTRAVRLNSAANNNARIFSNFIPAAAGEKFAMQAWVKGAAAYTGNAFWLAIYCYDGAGALLSGQVAYQGPLTTTPTLYSGSVTLPANTKQISFGVQLLSNASARTIYVSDVQARRQVSAVMIADGAVTATKINAGAVTADSVGTNLIITAAANIGNAVIDDAKIANIKSGKIVAEETATNLFVANTANIKDAIITSAKILNLSADKITTGSLQANQKIISGPLNGDHAEMSSTGFRVYTNDPLLGTPTEVIRMGTDTNDFFGVVNSAQELVASIDDSGASSFRRVVVKEEVLINGVSVSDMLKTSSAGMVGYWGGTISNLEQSGNVGIKETEYGIAQVTFPVVAGRTYYIRWQLPFYYATANEGEIWQRLVYRINGTPTPGNATECGIRVTNAWKLNSYQKDNLDGIILAPSTGNCTVMMTMRYPWGTTNSVVKVAQGAWTEAQVFDMGKAGIAAGGQSSGFGSLVSVGSPPPAPPAPPAPTQQYFVDLAPAGWASYRGDGSLRPGGDGVVQGWDPSGFNGDGGGFWYFFMPSITGTVDLATFYCYSNHWYYNSGGTAIFNLIPNGVGNNFSAFKLRGDMYVDGFPKPGGKEVLLPGDWLPYFRNGGTVGGSPGNQAVGISVGRANNTNLAYYGRFDGPSARLRIYYTQ